MATTKNPFGKTRDIEDPYATYTGPAGFVWKVLKTRQRPDLERKNANAIWFVAAQSDFTFGGYDMGDTYARDVRPYTLVSCTDEWREHYG